MLQTLKDGKSTIERSDSDEPQRNKSYALTIFDEVISAILELEDAGDIERDLEETSLRSCPQMHSEERHRVFR